VPCCSPDRRAVHRLQVSTRQGPHPASSRLAPGAAIRYRRSGEAFRRPRASGAPGKLYGSPGTPTKNAGRSAFRPASGRSSSATRNRTSRTDLAGSSPTRPLGPPPVAHLAGVDVMPLRLITARPQPTLNPLRCLRRAKGHGLRC
jgi:hypothetical protein